MTDRRLTEYAAGDMANILLITGFCLLIAGGFLKIMQRLTGGRVPGDIVLRYGSTTIFLPIVSCLLLSAILTIVLNLLLRR